MVIGMRAMQHDERLKTDASACDVHAPATQDLNVNGTTLHVRVGGRGPAVMLIHGYGETGDMWAPLAAELARDHRVIVPDLRGMGGVARPP